MKDLLSAIALWSLMRIKSRWKRRFFYCYYSGVVTIILYYCCSLGSGFENCSGRLNKMNSSVLIEANNLVVGLWVVSGKSLLFQYVNCQNITWITSMSGWRVYIQNVYWTKSFIWLTTDLNSAKFNLSFQHI